MTRFIILVAPAFLALVLVFAGCQTTKPAAPLAPPEASAIQAESAGFSPHGDPAHATMELSLLFGSTAFVRSWKVEITGAAGVVRTYTGHGDALPASLAWDGKSNAGVMVPEGAYTARLAVDYRDAYSPAFLESKGFLLDLTPPSAKLIFAPPRFTPSQAGVESPVAIMIDAFSQLARIDSWSLDIHDPEGNLFRSFSDKWPARLIEWDGKSLTGEMVKPATTYTAVASVRDEFGNTGMARASIPVSDISLASLPNIIQPRMDGFSPTSETSQDIMEILVAVGNPEAVRAWKIYILHADKGVQKTFNGEAGNVPHSVSWDGTADGGGQAPEGVYYAVLSVDYGSAYKSVFVRSRRFIFDVTPPAGTVTVSPAALAPDGRGGVKPLTFTVVAGSQLAAVDSYSLTVKDERGLAVLAVDGRWPKNTVSWDGRIAGGSFVDPTRPYSVSARVRDQFGNAGILTGILGVGELPVVSGAVSVTPKGRGFSPNGDTAMDAMELALSFGQPTAVKGWKLEIQSANGEIGQGGSGSAAVAVFRGDGSSLPASVVWDGKKADGRLAPEGRYTASMSVDYGTVFKPAAASSASFILDVTPPTGTLGLSPELFSPIAPDDTVRISVDARAPLAAMESWTMDIFDPAGNLFKRLSGKWPEAAVSWDGRGEGGEMVESAEDYPVQVRLRDEFGNTGMVKGTIPVDILVEKTATGYRIPASRIFFKAFTADYRKVAPELAQQNLQRLTRLAEKLKKFPGYRIRVVGHAVMINWDDPVLGKAEQEDILIPLSRARAEAVKQAMIDRGIDPAMISSEGVGASDQLVPDSNYAERWRNRRVAFFLEK
jgi:flagellar hook assembly protein FlgD